MLMILMQQIFAWINVLVAVGGAVISAMNLRRSRWAGLLLGGFVVETAVLMFYSLAALAIRNHLIAAAHLGAEYLMASVVGIVARASVVVGLAGVLSELSGSSKSLP